MKIAKLLKHIRGSFGEVDCLFAEHENDKPHARQIRTQVRKGEITPDDIEMIAMGYRCKKGASTQQIVSESNAMREFVSKQKKGDRVGNG